MAKRYHATKKFAKLAQLNADQDVGGLIGMAAGKAKRMMNDTCDRRRSTNVTGFFDQKKAREMKRAS